MIRIIRNSSPLRWLGVAAAGLVFAACGGSGDGGGGGGSDRLSGTLSVFLPDDTTLEAEPNGTVDQAHVLGDLGAGTTRTVVGTITSGAPDEFDVFQLVAPERVAVDLNLNGIATASDLDVYVVDPVSLQTVERFITNSSSESGTFVVKGTFFVIVEAFAGDSDYELTLAARTLPMPVPEIEPNDSAATAGYLGTFGAQDSLTVGGDGVDPGGDFFLLAVPEAATIDFSCDFTAGEDYDLFIYDATSSLATPTQTVSFETMAIPETGSIMVNAMTLVAVEVRPFSGATSPWTLAVTGSAFRLSGDGETAPLSASPRGRVAAMGKGLRRADGGYPFATAAAFPSMRGDLIVELEPGTGVQAGERASATMARVDGLVRSFGGAAVAAVPGGPAKVSFELPAGLDDAEATRYTFALAASLRGQPGVSIAEPDFRMEAFCVQTTPNDTLYNLQWHYEQIQLPAAWSLTTGSNAVRVAVLDTGSASSTDLAPREVAGLDMISDPSIAGDGDGIDNNPTDVGDSAGAQPSSFHGAHVAGTIGAVTNNGSGVAGVTWSSQIMHVRVLGRGGGSTFDILNAVLYAAGLANQSGQTTTLCEVQNLSLGGGGFSNSFQNAIDDATAAGSLIVAAAGNENSSTPSYPAAYGNVISVAAVDFEQRRAPYSNFHPTVDIAAPGGDVSSDRNGDGYADGVLSTKPDDTVSPTNFENFSFYQGTSMAAPHVAGVAALLLALDSNLTPAQLTSILTSTATDLGAPGRDNIFGDGLVNAHAACLAAAGGGGGGSPVLSLAASTTLFEGATGSRRIGVANVGEGSLDVTMVTASTNTGGNWLSASTVTVAQSGTTNTSAIDVVVSAGGLANGVYSGSVLVDSNGGSRTLAVTLALGGTGNSRNFEVFVLAVDADTFASVAQDVVQTNGSLSYGLENVPAGSYVIVAGTDDDNDGLICDEGEPLCGLYPSLGLPVRVDVDENGTVSGLNFPLEQATFAAGSGAPRGFRLLDTTAEVNQ